MKRSLACALLVAASSAAAAAQPPDYESYSLRLEYRQWRPDLRAEIQVGAPGVPGTRLDLKQDLGIEDDRTYELRGVLRFAPGHKLRVSATPVEYAGDVTARRSFSFNGRTYTVSTRVLSAIDGRLWQAAYEWDFVRRPQGYLGVYAGSALFDGQARVRAPSLGFDEARESRTPIPIVGAAARVYAGGLSLEGEIGGITLGDRAHGYDLGLSARLHLSKSLAAQAGYRVIDVEGKDDPDFVNIRMKGWTFGVELSL